jgi:hypothetical protein
LQPGRKVQEDKHFQKDGLLCKTQKEKGIDFVADTRNPAKNRLRYNVSQRPHIGGRKHIRIPNSQTTQTHPQTQVINVGLKR